MLSVFVVHGTEREPLLPVWESDSDVLQVSVAGYARCVVGFSSTLPECMPARDGTDVQTVTASQHLTAVCVCRHCVMEHVTL